MLGEKKRFYSLSHKTINSSDILPSFLSLLLHLLVGSALGTLTGQFDDLLVDAKRSSLSLYSCQSNYIIIIT